MTTASSPQEMMEQMVDRTRARPIHYRLWLVSTGGTFIDGFATFMTGIAIPLLKARFDPDPTLIGLLGASLVLGAVLGASAGGALSDRLGRKIIYLADMSLLGVAALLFALAPNFPFMILCQFLIGIGIGMDFPVSSSYISELIPKSRQRQMLAATITFQAIGEITAALLAWLILARVDSLGAWRYLAGATAIPAVVTFVARWSVPESPHWLMEKGRNREAAEAIARILPEEKSRLEQLGQAAGELTERVTGKTTEKKADYSLLFSPRYRKITMLTAGAWFFMDIATYGVGLFTPIILGSLTLGSLPDVAGMNLIAREFATDKGSGIVDIFLLLGFLLGIRLIRSFGPFRLQLLGFAGMVAGMLVLALASSLPDTAGSRLGLIYLGFIVFNLCMNAGPNTTTFTLPAQLFPTRIRASGSGLAAACGKVGATLGIFFLPGLKASFGISGVLILMAIVSGFGWLITFIFRPKRPSSIA
ncbi:MFS transporter [Pannus brasiliensis CCIBt3594]|uniref:MFS transporter n=1 Tax=Pannus brasiliensis CCIBt3594 TaxID=1427578 RepID=A0AAW9QZ05_9CHRO